MKAMKREGWRTKTCMVERKKSIIPYVSET